MTFMVAPPDYTVFDWLQMMLLEKQYHDDLKMELQGVSTINKQSSAENMESKEESLPDVQQSAIDTEDPSRLMMSRKKRGLAIAIEVTLLALSYFLSWTPELPCCYSFIIGISSLVWLLCFSLIRWASNGRRIGLKNSRSGKGILKQLRNLRRSTKKLNFPEFL